MSIEPQLSLDAVLTDPAALNGISREQVLSLLARVASIQMLLVQNMAAGGVGDTEKPAPAVAPAEPAPAWSEADLLRVDEAARLLAVPRRWLYRHARNLPFARKLSRKCLRFSRSGMARWLATKRYEQVRPAR